MNFGRLASSLSRSAEIGTWLGLVTGIGAAQFDPADFRDAGVLADPAGPRAFTVTWLGGACDKDAALVLRTTDSGYDIWLPAPLPERMPGIVFSPPASALRVTVLIRPKLPGQTARKGQMYFSLENVTRHKGRCGNYPKNGVEKDDMRFAEAQEEGIVVDGPHDAHTREEVSEATIAIEATDTAAAGTLTVRPAPDVIVDAVRVALKEAGRPIPANDWIAALALQHGLAVLGPTAPRFWSCGRFRAARMPQRPPV